MDVVYKDLSYSHVKAEDSSDCIIDLEAESPSINSNQTWYNDITQKIHKSTHYGNEKYVDDMMVMYHRSLKEKIINSKDKIKLKDQVLTHIKYFYLYYKEIEHSLLDTNYFIRMEDILKCYCDLELEVVHNLSKQRENKKHFLLVIRRLCKVMGIYLYHKLKHILHVLLKMNYNARNPACQMVMRKIYSHFLISLPIEPLSDEVFCRYYLVFERYKEIAKPEEKKAIGEFIFFKFGKSRDYLTTNSLMKKILTPSCDSVTDIVTHLFDSRTTVIQTYFDYLKNNEMDKLNRLNTNIDPQCGSSDFLKTYNDVLCTFSEATIDIDSNTESTIKDSDSDIELLEEGGTIVVSDAEDIDEIIYKQKNIQSRHRTKKKKVAKPKSVSEVISLDSDDDLPSIQDKTPSISILTTEMQHPTLSNISTPSTSAMPTSDSPFVSSKHTTTSTLAPSKSTVPVSTVSKLDFKSLNLDESRPLTSSIENVSETVTTSVAPSLNKERSFVINEDQESKSLTTYQISSDSKLVKCKTQSETLNLFTMLVTTIPRFDFNQPDASETNNLDDSSETTEKGGASKEYGIKFSSPAFISRQLSSPVKTPALFNILATKHWTHQGPRKDSKECTPSMLPLLLMSKLKLNEIACQVIPEKTTENVVDLPNEVNELLPMEEVLFQSSLNCLAKKQLNITQPQTTLPSNSVPSATPLATGNVLFINRQTATTQKSSIILPSKLSPSSCVSTQQQICATFPTNTATPSTSSEQSNLSQIVSTPMETVSHSWSVQKPTCTSLLHETLNESQESQIVPPSSTNQTVPSFSNVKTSQFSPVTINKESYFSTMQPDMTALPSLPQQTDATDIYLQETLPKNVSSCVDHKVVENKLILTSQSEAFLQPSNNKTSVEVSDLENQVFPKNIHTEMVSSPMASSTENTLLVKSLSSTPIMSPQLIATENLAPSSTSESEITHEKSDSLCLTFPSLSSCLLNQSNTQTSSQSLTPTIQIDDKILATYTVDSMKASTQDTSFIQTATLLENVECEKIAEESSVPISSTDPLLLTIASPKELSFRHLNSPNKNSLIEEKVIEEQCKQQLPCLVIVSSIGDTSSIDTLTTSMSSFEYTSLRNGSVLETSLSVNTSTEEKTVSKNVEKMDISAEQPCISTSPDVSNIFSLPPCISQVHEQASSESPVMKNLQSFEIEEYRKESTINEAATLIPLSETMSEESNKLSEIKCSTSSSDLSPRNYRTDHDFDNGVCGCGYCENKHDRKVEKLKNSSESVSYNYLGMITPPSDPRSDKNLIDSEDSEYDSIFGVERHTENRKNFSHVNRNLGNPFNSRREISPSKVEVDPISKDPHSDNSGLKNVVIKSVETVRNDDLNISFTDSEKNDNNKCITASEQEDDLCSNHDHTDNHSDDEERSTTDVDIGETVVVPVVPNDSIVSCNLLPKRATNSSNNFSGCNNLEEEDEHNDREQEEEEDEYDGNTSSTESVDPQEKYNNFHDVTHSFPGNDKIANRKLGKFKIKSKSKNVRFKRSKNEMERIKGYNSENNKTHNPIISNLPGPNIEFDWILTGPIGDIKATNNSQYYENSDGNFNLFGFANSIDPLFGEVSKNSISVDKSKEIDSPAYDTINSDDIRDYMKNEFSYKVAFETEEFMNKTNGSGGHSSSKCGVSFNDVVDTRCITPAPNKLKKTHKRKYVVRDRIKCFVDPHDQKLNMVTKVVLNKVSDDVLLKKYKVIHHNTLRTCIRKQMDFGSSEENDILLKGTVDFTSKDCYGSDNCRENKLLNDTNNAKTLPSSTNENKDTFPESNTEFSNSPKFLPNSDELQQCVDKTLEEDVLPTVNIHPDIPFLSDNSNFYNLKLSNETYKMFVEETVAGLDLEELSKTSELNITQQENEMQINSAQNSDQNILLNGSQNYLILNTELQDEKLEVDVVGISENEIEELKEHSTNPVLIATIENFNPDNSDEKEVNKNTLAILESIRESSSATCNFVLENYYLGNGFLNDVCDKDKLQNELTSVNSAEANTFNYLTDDLCTYFLPDKVLNKTDILPQNQEFYFNDEMCIYNVNTDVVDDRRQIHTNGIMNQVNENIKEIFSSNAVNIKSNSPLSNCQYTHEKIPNTAIENLGNYDQILESSKVNSDPFADTHQKEKPGDNIRSNLVNASSTSYKSELPLISLSKSIYEEGTKKHRKSSREKPKHSKKKSKRSRRKESKKSTAPVAIDYRSDGKSPGHRQPSTGDFTACKDQLHVKESNTNFENVNKTVETFNTHSNVKYLNDCSKLHERKVNERVTVQKTSQKRRNECLSNGTSNIKSDNKIPLDISEQFNIKDAASHNSPGNSSGIDDNEIDINNFYGELNDVELSHLIESLNSGSETRLPFKKRRVSVNVKHEVKYDPNKEEISYPATPMISIAEVEALQNKNSARPFKTPAERKEMPPLPVYYNVNSEPSPIITDQFNINNHTYNNPTINYHMSNMPMPFIPCASYFPIPPIILPFNNLPQFDQNSTTNVNCNKATGLPQPFKPVKKEKSKEKNLYSTNYCYN